MCSARASADLASRCRLVVGLDQAAASADHLAERPEADAGPVRGRPTGVPPDVLGDTVEVLDELPAEPRLADPRRPDDRHQPRTPLAARRLEQVLEEPDLVVATDERRLEALPGATTVPLADDAQRPPGGDRAGLALQLLLADWFEGDRQRRRLVRPLADEDRARCCDRLEAGGGVDDVARDHPLVRGAEGDGGLSGQDADPCLDGRAQRPHGFDEVERGTDRPPGIVLERDRCAPDGHHRVADELLDDAAVGVDDGARHVEVAGQDLADLLRVALLGERGEADEVGEQDRDVAALGDGLGRRRERRAASRAAVDGRCSRRAQHRPAFAAELRVGQRRRAARRADGRETGATVLAELGSGRVLAPADGTGHARLLGWDRVKVSA